MPKSGAIPFLLVLGAAPLLLIPAGQLDASDRGPFHKRTINAVTACGVPRANVRLTYQRELESDVVMISDLGGVDEARLRCVAQAVPPVYIVWIEAEDQRFRYEKLKYREDGRIARAEAIAWLEARGLLGKVPEYDPGKGIELFARGLEAACSIRPGHALEAYGSFTLAIRPGLFGDTAAPDLGDDFTCLTRAFAASNADQHGLFLGFIGNEAYQWENRK